MNIKLLDCTLRDGGYINDWKFGNNSIINIFRNLVNSGVEIIEIGFIDDNVEESLNNSIMTNTKILNQIFKNEEKKNSTIVAMIDYGTCDINNVEDKSETFIDGIRLTFKKKDLKNALNYCKQLKNKGYKVSVQPVSVTSYTEEEFKELVEKVNELQPFAMSVVDTYGVMDKDETIKYFKVLDENLDKSIHRGYHSHNNLQMSFSNSIEVLNACKSDNIILDSSLYGMGKYAGNANLELLCSYLNNNYEKKYNIDMILELIHKEILPIYNNKQWGYNLYNYLSANNRCHPKYVTFLRNKSNLSIKDIDNILKELHNNLVYDETKIEEIYDKYILKNSRK